MKCEICDSINNYKLRCESGVWLCMECVGKRYIPIEREFGLIEKEVVGSIGNVHKSRLKEMDLRTRLEDKPGGGYYYGRRMPDGRISDREVDLRP